MWKRKAAEPNGFPTVDYFFLSMLAESLDGFRFRGQVVFSASKKAVLYFPFTKGSVQNQPLVIPAGVALKRLTPSQHTNTNHRTA